MPRSSVILAAAGLLVAASPVAAEETCIEFEAYLHPGDAIDVTVTDPVWIQLGAEFDHVYRFTVSAVPRTTTEVWGSVVDNRTGDAIFVSPIPY